jgi:hypothetical protein
LTARLQGQSISRKWLSAEQTIYLREKPATKQIARFSRHRSALQRLALHPENRTPCIAQLPDLG